MDADNSGLISLEEGKAGLLAVGMQEAVVEHIAGIITSVAKSEGKDPSQEMPADDILDIVEGLGFAYCTLSADERCAQIDGLQSAIDIVPWG